MNNRFLSTKRLEGLFCILLISVLFFACSKSSNNTSNQKVSHLMAINLITDKPAGIVITLSGNGISQAPLYYTDFTGGYLSINSGLTTVQTYNYNSPTTPLTSNSFSFDTSKYYSLFTVGAGGVYNNIITRDNFDSLSATNGQAYIRYVNAIADSSSPKVIIANGSNVFNENAHYTYVSPFSPIQPGQATINVNNGGTISTNRTVTLVAKNAYTVILSGIPGATDSVTSVQIRYIINGQLQ